MFPEKRIGFGASGLFVDESRRETRRAGLARVSGKQDGFHLQNLWRFPKTI
jgi:hypothetical protein